MKKSSKYQTAVEWVESGKPCASRYGLGYRGAPTSMITNEEAKQLLPKYDFGMGFYELSFREHNGQTVLLFNELGENDLY